MEFGSENPAWPGLPRRLSDVEPSFCDGQRAAPSPAVPRNSGLRAAVEHFLDFVVQAPRSK